MKLPYISIEGVGNTPEEKLDSLIKLEPILAWLGYEALGIEMYFPLPKNDDGIFLIGYRDKYIRYYTHRGANNPKRFLASDVTGIINYVTGSRK